MAGWQAFGALAFGFIVATPCHSPTNDEAENEGVRRLEFQVQHRHKRHGSMLPSLLTDWRVRLTTRTHPRRTSNSGTSQ